MYVSKNLKRIIVASMVAGSLTFTPEIYNLLPISIAEAKVQMYNGIGEDYASEIESQEIAKLRAKAKAIRAATEKAGVYLKNYSRSINAVLQDDEITAIAVNSYQIVGEVHYDKTVNQLSDTVTVIVWKATVQINVDDAEIQNWYRRDDKNRSTIVRQTNEAIRTAEENELQVEDLRQRAQNAMTDAEQEAIKAEYEKIDNEFQANQLLEEGNQLYYQGDYNGAIAKYNEALELNPKYALAYNNRGAAYKNLQKYNEAIADYTKAIKLNPKYVDAYLNRGNAYYKLQNYKAAMEDYNKAIQINAKYAEAYNNRGAAYYNLKNYTAAIADYTKAIKINPNYAAAYRHRGFCYKKIGDNARAEADFAKARELGYNG